ncbi:hypothetical protein Fmac_024995 [Flemingia macrophylla]|uniref:Uncharacterized protein n=1 Tax=Flemingia macrophylla TaxID=520843 RepID=A0ABD1LQY3_9FABA
MATPKNLFVKTIEWRFSLVFGHFKANEYIFKTTRATIVGAPIFRVTIDGDSTREALRAELKIMREAALWRRSQGISMEGDEELLAQTKVKVEPKRMSG